MGASGRKSWSRVVILIGVVYFVVTGTAVRALLVITFVIAVGTYTFEYGLLPSHGGFLLPAAGDAIRRTSAMWSSREGSTMFRIPLFLSYLVLIGVTAGALPGWRRLRDSRGE